MELVPLLSLLVKMVYLPLSEQYYYHVYGANILKNTSFIFPEGSFCVSSELINNYTHNNNSYKAVESASNHLVIYCQIAYCVPSILVTITLGPLMDRFGRHIGMVLPIAGITIQGIISIYIVAYNLDPYYFILANFMGGTLGGVTSIFAASFAYVADVTAHRWRSLRIGLVEAAMAFGSSGGQFLSGYWLHKGNCDYMPPLLFCTGCSLFVLAYVVFVLPEARTTSERAMLRCKSPDWLRSYIEGFKLYCGRLSLPSTWKLYAATIVIMVMGLNIIGSVYIGVYFLKAPPFDFNSLHIGFYQGLKSTSQGLANIFIVGAFVLLKVGDTWMMLVALLFHIVCNALIGFSSRAWQLYASMKELCQAWPLFLLCVVLQLLQ